jgi:hypothetical protein
MIEYIEVVDSGMWLVDVFLPLLSMQGTFHGKGSVSGSFKGTHWE